MKKINKNIFLLCIGSLAIGLLAIVSCGQDKAKDRITQEKITKASEANFKQDKDLEQTKVSNQKLSATYEPEQVFDTETITDAPLMNKDDLQFEELDGPVINARPVNLPSGMPYYCNPYEYPRNIILSIAACKPYQSLFYQIWGTSYGYYPYMNKFLRKSRRIRKNAYYGGARYPGYRIWDGDAVGRVKKFKNYDDDDDRRRRRRRKYR